MTINDAESLQGKNSVSTQSDMRLVAILLRDVSGGKFLSCLFKPRICLSGPARPEITMIDTRVKYSVHIAIQSKRRGRDVSVSDGGEVGG